VPQLIEPPNSVVLLVGREEFSPPSSFNGQTCVATSDCLAIGVADSPTTVTLGPSPASGELTVLAQHVIETEGLVSLRDVYSREYETMGSPAGHALVTVWGNDPTEPSELVIQVVEHRP
jgi:hypothetical protein